MSPTSTQLLVNEERATKRIKAARTRSKKNKKNNNAAVDGRSDDSTPFRTDGPSSSGGKKPISRLSRNYPRTDTDGEIVVSSGTSKKQHQHEQQHQQQHKKQHKKQQQAKRPKKKRRLHSEVCVDNNNVVEDSNSCASHHPTVNDTQIQQPQQQRQEQKQSQQDQQSSSLSLASRLKRHRGTASSTPLPPEWSGISSSSSTTVVPRFLSPNNNNNNNNKNMNNNDPFNTCLKECYQGFHWENPSDLPPTIHQSFTSAFHALNDAGLFLYDIVQPGGKRLSRTFVTRTLIGAPGSTYRYLGLRLFSHPWDDVDTRGDTTTHTDNNIPTTTPTALEG